MIDWIYEIHGKIEDGMVNQTNSCVALSENLLFLLGVKAPKDKWKSMRDYYTRDYNMFHELLIPGEGTKESVHKIYTPSGKSLYVLNPENHGDGDRLYVKCGCLNVPFSMLYGENDAKLRVLPVVVIDFDVFKPCGERGVISINEDNCSIQMFHCKSFESAEYVLRYMQLNTRVCYGTVHGDFSIVTVKVKGMEELTLHEVFGNDGLRPTRKINTDCNGWYDGISIVPIHDHTIIKDFSYFPNQYHVSVKHEELNYQEDRLYKRMHYDEYRSVYDAVFIGEEKEILLLWLVHLRETVRALKRTGDGMETMYVILTRDQIDVITDISQSMSNQVSKSKTLRENTNNGTLFDLHMLTRVPPSQAFMKKEMLLTDHETDEFINARILNPLTYNPSGSTVGIIRLDMLYYTLIAYTAPGTGYYDDNIIYNFGRRDGAMKPEKHALSTFIETLCDIDPVKIDTYYEDLFNSTVPMQEMFMKGTAEAYNERDIEHGRQYTDLQEMIDEAEPARRALLAECNKPVLSPRQLEEVMQPHQVMVDEYDFEAITDGVTVSAAM